MTLKVNYILAASLLAPLLAKANYTPYDISCAKWTLIDGSEASCTSHVDQDGQQCQWCDAGSDQGLCMTEDQAEIAQQIGIQCGESSTIEGSPYDISCAVTMFTGGDESACTGTNDQDGQPCVWCQASPDKGLCLTEQQSEIAEQAGVQCSADISEEESESEDLDGSPYDISCVVTSLSGADEATCTATKDQDGEACVWCESGAGQGVCFTETQAETAQQIGLQCSSEYIVDEESETDEVGGSPYDISCVVSSLSGGDKATCTATKDQDGEACVWCESGADQGVCFTEAQAETAQQIGLQCSGSVNTFDEEDDEEDDWVDEEDEDEEDFEEDQEEDEEDEDAEDFEDDEDEEEFEDEDDEEEIEGDEDDEDYDFEEEEFEDEEEFENDFEYDIEEEELDEEEEAYLELARLGITGSPYDISCIVTTLTGGDKDTCEATQDQDGEACVYCEAGPDQGLCLTEEQAQIAEQAGIQCGSEKILDGVGAAVE